MLSVDEVGAPLPRRLLDAAGGFLWWYADATDADGNGFVCIWSFGLPFLPGLASGARAGVRTRPGDRPSLNLSIYERGRQLCYHLVELDPSEVTWSGDRWRFGRSELVLEAERDQVVLRAELDLDVPGGPPLRGSFTLRGPQARWPARPAPADDAHRWAPILGHAAATASFSSGDQPLLSLVGSGYHDRNGCPSGLHELGIDHWIWGRAEVRDETILVYLSWARVGAPELLVGVGDRAGAFTFGPATVTLGAPRTARFGMPWWGEIEVTGLDRRLRLSLQPPADDGPFYLRCPLRIEVVGGAQGAGWAELCRPDRIDTPLLRPLVRMAVQPPRSRGSLWLPLFQGPRAGRWVRLLRHWLARATGAA